MQEKVISVIINADTRPGYLRHARGEEYGFVSLVGVRSVDFLTEGVKQKINFFRGRKIQVILYVDKHEEMTEELWNELKHIVLPCGNGSKIIFQPHDRTDYRWNDKIYIDAFKEADGDYIVHFDQDANAYRTDDCAIIDDYLRWLEVYKYICQHWDGQGDEMYHASTRFFICKKEILDIPLIEARYKEGVINGRHNPCLEFTLGNLAGEGNVLYPQPQDDYISFNWAKYYGGTIKRLNEMKPQDAIDYVKNELGLCGPNDVIDKDINEQNGVHRY